MTPRSEMSVGAPSNQLVTVPNVISLARLVVACGLPFVPLSWRLPLLLSAALSDWLDGLIAKLTDARSAAGQLLDPIADKALVISSIVTLLVSREIHWWQALMVIPRDLAVGVVCLTAAAQRELWAFRRMKPSVMGKLTTVLVFAWVVSAMLAWASPLRMPLFAAAAFCSTATALEYLLRLRRGLRERRRASSGTDPRRQSPPADPAR